MWLVEARQGAWREDYWNEAATPGQEVQLKVEGISRRGVNWQEAECMQGAGLAGRWTTEGMESTHSYKETSV